jgi:hypothetical protein
VLDYEQVVLLLEALAHKGNESKSNTAKPIVFTVKLVTRIDTMFITNPALTYIYNT